LTAGDDEQAHRFPVVDKMAIPEEGLKLGTPLEEVGRLQPVRDPRPQPRLGQREIADQAIVGQDRPAGEPRVIQATEHVLLFHADPESIGLGPSMI
jgi:hypothetical protein